MVKKISVIIPVKNRANLLPATLNNILAQTCSPAEVIVVDDGSTDALPEVISRYKDRVIFISNEGKGPGAARNTGYNASTGEYIQFFDSDDLMSRNKLEVQAELMIKSQAGMVYSPHVKAFEDENKNWIQQDVILYYHSIPKELRFDQWLIRGACMITQSCLFDRMIFKETGLWRTDLMPHEDLEFLFRIGKAVPYPAHTNEVAVIYRQHGNQITDKMVKLETKILDQYKALQLIKDNMKGNYSWLDSIVVKGSIYNLLKSLGSKMNSTEFQKDTGLVEAASGLYLKILSKYNRTMTKSQWKLLHGVSHSPDIFKMYINQL